MPGNTGEFPFEWPILSAFRAHRQHATTTRGFEDTRTTAKTAGCRELNRNRRRVTPIRHT